MAEPNGGEKEPKNDVDDGNQKKAIDEDYAQGSGSSER